MMTYKVFVDNVLVGHDKFDWENRVDHGISDAQDAQGVFCMLRAPNVRFMLVMTLISEEPARNGGVKRVFKVNE